MKERDQKETPQIISDLNANLNPTEVTVEEIAERIGISKDILYEWVRTDAELSEALERFKTLQEEDPFRTGTVEDAWIGSLVIAFILTETRDKHYKHKIFRAKMSLYK